MQLSQSNINKLNILLQCTGWQNCKYSDCPHYSAVNDRCEWESFLNILAVRCAQSFDKFPIPDAQEVNNIEISENEGDTPNV